MSTQTQTNDMYSIYKQNVQKYFENISKTTPQYFQFVTQLQDECVKTCEKTINATMTVQQEFAKKAGITTDVPESAKTAITDFNKQIVQTSTVNSQLIKTAVDTATQNIKAFSNNIDAFTTLNNNIVQLWTTTFTHKK